MRKKLMIQSAQLHSPNDCDNANEETLKDIDALMV